MTTNFITPPDFVDEPNHNILLIDTDPADVETLAFLCAGHDEPFNIYLYREGMQDIEWLNKAAGQVDAIIINTEQNGLTPTKDMLVDLPKSYHYGPKNFLNNARKHATVLEYFINRANERKHSENTL